MCDDVFDENDSDQEVVGRAWQKSVTQINKAGYREGLEKGKEEVLQEGFNQTFAASSQIVYRIAELRGKISAKLSYKLLKKGGRLTDKQEAELQNLLQEVVLFESELLQGSKVNFSDWLTSLGENCDKTGQSGEPVSDDSGQSDVSRNLNTKVSSGGHQNKENEESDHQKELEHESLNDRRNKTGIESGGDEMSDERAITSVNAVGRDTGTEFTKGFDRVGCDNFSRSSVEYKLTHWNEKIQSILFNT